MTVRAGALNRRVTVQQRATGHDAYGQESETWNTLFTTWASIETLDGRELLAAQAIATESTHRLTFRYRATLAVIDGTKCRVMYQGRIFNIKSLDDVDTRHEYFEALCTEGLNAG